MIDKSVVVILLCLHLNVCDDQFLVTKVSTRTSTIPGSGMDSGGWFDTGGSFSLRICQEFECCDTGFLNTEDDNWELGQVDWFVGRQIGVCHNLELSDKSSVMVTLQHSGSNAGLLDWVKLHSWDVNKEWTCYIGVRLDYDESHSSRCQLEILHDTSNDNIVCNGRAEFCKLRFDQFLFPGSHNSGTGQKNGSFRCAFKNQDLDILEQLEFGIRFFDVDIIFSHAFGCHGLETGHGSKPELGLYQCYGKLSILLTDMRRWLDHHKSEVVVLNFGNIEYPSETIPALVEMLNSMFPAPSQTTSVTLNDQFKLTGSWPTLEQAVRSNQRIFVFIRDAAGVITQQDTMMVKEIKVKPTEKTDTTKSKGEVKILTSYKAEDAEGDCMYVLDTNKLACNKDAELKTDFLKLSFFSAFGESGTFGTECVHKTARKCNVWPEAVVRNCTARPYRPNFILLDYPNYQSNAKTSIIQLCYDINQERVKTLENTQKSEK